MLLALTAVSATQGAELDMLSRAQLRLERVAKRDSAKASQGLERLARMKQRLGVAQTSSLAMIVLSGDADIDALEQQGVEILRRKGDIAFVAVPTDRVEAVAATPGVDRFQLARTMRPMMDKARLASGVAEAHAGTNLNHPYTGAGVITGIVDGGVDPNHINFRNEDGSSRVGYVGHLRLNSTGNTLLESRYGELQDLPVSSFRTDDAAQFHGTHTMGIMAGGYKGQARVAEGDLTTGIATISEKPNPYYGVATGSQIAVSCGDLMDMLIAMGMDDICQYAFESGGERRTVINLSLGSNIGPHDGSDVMHQYINQLVAQDNAIVCVAAGNEGDLPIALHGTFDESRRELKSFIRPYVYTDMRYGNLVIYSEDASEFSVQAVVYNRSRGRVAFSAPVDSNTGGEAVYYVSSADFKSSANDVVSSTFARAFDGYVGMGSMTDPYSGRYYAMIDFYTVDSDENADANYILGFIIKPKAETEGKRVDVYCDGAFTAIDSYEQAGWDDGMYDGTISDMACGDNILVVGSYNTREYWGSLDGGTYSYNGLFPVGDITSFSSYARLKDGTELPHVCAPGAAVISSTNSYYVADPYNQISPAYLHAEVTDGDRTYHWQQTTGTSMATPYVTGSIALWLEADPTLTIADVKDIVAQTAIVDDQVRNTGTPLQWGAGKFDAYGGLKEVIRRASGIHETGAADSRLMVSSTGTNHTFFLGGAVSVTVELFDMSGRRVAVTTQSGDQATLDTAALPAGAYIARVNGAHSAKIMTR